MPYSHVSNLLGPFGLCSLMAGSGEAPWTKVGRLPFLLLVVVGLGMRCSATDALELLLWLGAGLCQTVL